MEPAVTRERLIPIRGMGRNLLHRPAVIAASVRVDRAGPHRTAGGLVLALVVVAFVPCW
jgi:hypothetical protein